MGDWPDRTGEAPEFLRGGIAWWDGAPANSPAGGPGPGYFRVYMERAGATFRASYEYVEQQTRPLRDWAMGTANSVVAYSQETIDGVMCVYEARNKAVELAPEIILEETGRGLKDLVSGLLPGLLLVAAVLALTTIAGGAVGALLGAIGGLGAGAIPGTAIGAGVGLDIGIALLTWAGLVMLVEFIGKKLIEVVNLLVEGVSIAWAARKKHGPDREATIYIGARKMARSIGVFFRLILEGIVLFLVGKATGRAARPLAEQIAQARRNVPGLVEGLRRSRLGGGFARWVESNWEALVRDPKLNPELPKASSGGAAPASKPSPAGKPAPKKKPAPVKPPKQGGAYKDVPANGGEVHHTPADSISPLSRDKGPGFRMEKKDHYKTASWGSSKEAKAYRAAQKKLIDEGRFRQAIEMDIKDVRSKFGNKYDTGIKEMLEYVETLPPVKPKT
ncbi:MAG TPA: hypothetical protein VNA19_13395 [Pyrinomonadaceae bacterium]|jgi:hypothetical protein|nr:hypothetical protein [Pyrinomonadaceae bacterium]